MRCYFWILSKRWMAVCVLLILMMSYIYQFNKVSILNFMIRHGRPEQESKRFILHYRNVDGIITTPANLKSLSNVRRYEISGSKDHNFSYCMVYKAATTSWLRIIRFLNGEYKEVETPFLISKARVHYYKARKYIKYLYYKKDNTFIKNSLRIMTVRDPYTRLWSGYIDKFLLPDFWKSRGNAIIRMVRKHGDKYVKHCGNDVTFKEFIDYILARNGSMKNWNQDKHWLPASVICRQDVFRPHLVIKQERLAVDMPLIFDKLNLSWITNKTKNINLTEFEMIDQIYYVFAMGAHGCVSNIKMAELIWQAYKYNAYIPPDTPFPENQIQNNITAPQFVKIIKDIRKEWKVTKSQIKEQKRNALVAAYSTIPKDTLRKLRDYYMADFISFGYDSEPHDIFKV